MKTNNAPQNMGPKGAPPKRKMNFGALKRVLKMLISYYPVLLPLAVFCIVFSAVVATAPAIFNQQILAAIENWYQSKDWASAKALCVIAFIGFCSYSAYGGYYSRVSG